MARGQLRVLHALDVARTQLFHFMAIVIAGMGFFTDAYDFFAISLVSRHGPHRLPVLPGTHTSRRLRRHQRDRPVRRRPGATRLRLARRQDGPQAHLRRHARPHGCHLPRFRPLLQQASRQERGHCALLLPFLARRQHRRRLPALGDHHVGVRQQEETRRLHRRCFRHAGFWQSCRRDRWNGVVSGLSEQHCIQRRLRLANCTYVRRRSGNPHILLAHEDARHGEVHGPRRHGREEGSLGHVLGPQRGHCSGERSCQRARHARPVRSLLSRVPPPPWHPPPRHKRVLARCRHHLLLAEPFHERHLHQCQAASGTGQHSSSQPVPADDQNHRAAHGLRALRYVARVLLHRRIRRPHRPCLNSATRLHHDVSLHNLPRRPL